ncbi:MAG: hypothetical protein PHT33_03475 [bacterium]|nr:hypothetical protein [bacterium]
MQNTIAGCLIAAIVLLFFTAMLRRGSDHDEVRRRALEAKLDHSEAGARVSISDETAGSAIKDKETD